MKSLKYHNSLNSITNELTKLTPSLRLCLAIYLEGGRNDSFLRHDHTRKRPVSSLGSLGFSWESRDLFFQPEELKW